jgi:hypothetical protein
MSGLGYQRKAKPMGPDNAVEVQRALINAVTNAYQLNPGMRDNDLELIADASERLDKRLDNHQTGIDEYKTILKALNDLNAAMLIMSTLRHLRKLEGGR